MVERTGWSAGSEPFVEDELAGQRASDATNDGHRHGYAMSQLTSSILDPKYVAGITVTAHGPLGTWRLRPHRPRNRPNRRSVPKGS